MRVVMVLGLVVGAVAVWPAVDRAPTAEAGDETGGEPGHEATVGAGGGSPVRRRSRGTSLLRRRVRDDWAADLAEVVAVGLSAGLDLPAAVRVAARSPAVAGAEPGVAALHGGSDPVAGLEALAADRPAGEAADLRVLARAWRLAEVTGAPVAATTRAAAAAVRARSATRGRTEAAMAGPRASMRLLTLLPLGGPVVGALVGLDPVALYATDGARLCAVVGLGLTVLGWSWAAALLRRAARPRTTGPAP